MPTIEDSFDGGALSSIDGVVPTTSPDGAPWSDSSAPSGWRWARTGSGALLATQTGTGLNQATLYLNVPDCTTLDYEIRYIIGAGATGYAWPLNALISADDDFNQFLLVPNTVTTGVEFTATGTITGDFTGSSSIQIAGLCGSGGPGVSLTYVAFTLSSAGAPDFWTELVGSHEVP